MNRKQRRAGRTGEKPVAPAARRESSEAFDLHDLGVQALQTGDHAGAADLIVRAIAVNGQVASFHYNLAIAQKALGRLEDAAASYRRALLLKPDYPEAHNNLGNVLKALGRRQEAGASFEQALRARPGYAEAHYNLGVLFAEAGDGPQAAAHLQACLARDPGDSRGAGMMLAYLGLAAAPSRTPPAHLVQLYEQRSQSWDRDRFDHGHALVAGALRAHAADGRRDVLDAGCGTGLVGALVRDLATQLDGVDLSVSMLEQARDKKTYDRLYQEDLASFLAAHQNCYDAILSAATLIHFGDLAAVFESAARALRKEGLFVFTLFCNETDDADFAVAAHFNLARNGCYWHGAGYVEAVAKRCGFAVERLEKVVHEHDLDNKPVMGFLVVLRRLQDA